MSLGGLEWSGGVSPKGICSNSLLPGTDPQHTESQSHIWIWIYQGKPEQLSCPHTGTGNLTGLPCCSATPGAPPKLSFYTFSKCQQNSSVIYAAQPAAFSASPVIFTRSCLGKCLWQKLTRRDLVLQMLHTLKTRGQGGRKKLIN